MNRRASHRIALAGGVGLAAFAGGLFIPWAGGIISAAGFVVIMASAAAASLAIRKDSREAMYRAMNAERTEAERTLRARAHGNSVDDLKNDALRQGAGLFGPDADLRIAKVGHIATAVVTKGGAFTAEVIVVAHPATLPTGSAS